MSARGRGLGRQRPAGVRGAQREAGPGAERGPPATTLGGQGGLARRVRRGRQSFRYSRSRFVCDRLTGISVPFASFILRM